MALWCLPGSHVWGTAGGGAGRAVSVTELFAWNQSHKSPSCFYAAAPFGAFYPSADIQRETGVASERRPS